MHGIAGLILFLSLALGGFIAAYNGAWWTFFGSFLGALLHIFLSSWFVFIAERFEYIFSFIQKKAVRCVRTLADFFALNIVPRFFTDTNVTTLWKEEYNKIWKFICVVTNLYISKSKKSFVSFLYSVTLDAPLVYIRWIILGFFVASLTESVRIHSISGNLDILLGVLIAIVYLKINCSDLKNETIQSANEEIPQIIFAHLEQVSSDNVHVLLDVNEEKADACSFLRRKKYFLGQIVTSSWLLFDCMYNLSFALLVLFLISIPGTVLVLVTISVVIPAVIIIAFLQEIKEKELVETRLKHDAASDLLHNIRLLGWLQSCHTRLELVHTIEKTSSKLLREKNLSREHTSSLIKIVRLLFFTMFSLSILFPVLQIQSGMFSTRVAILYAFSMMSLWYAISTVGSLLRKIFAASFSLGGIDSILTYLSEDPQKALTPICLKGNEKSILIEPITFGLPGEPLLLVSTEKAEIALSVDLPVVTRVIGNHTTEILQLMSGILSPLSGNIYIGEHPTHTLSHLMIYIPDKIPLFHNVRIIDLFEWLVFGDKLNSIPMTERDRELTDREKLVKSSEWALSQVGLLGEIKVTGREEYTGVNMLLAKRNVLDEDQNRKLFYALTLARLRYLQKYNSSWRPILIAIDGLHRISHLDSRTQIARVFYDLSKALHCNLFLACRDEREIGALDGSKEFVVTSAASELYTPTLMTNAKMKQRGEASQLVIGTHDSRLRFLDKNVTAAYKKLLNTITQQM